jgi:hypothetical protein
VVGGPSALFSAVYGVKNATSLTYMNDQRRHPIAFGSAFHLEEDGPTEAPTTYQPIQFMFAQIKRALLGYVSLSEIEKTGLFPWRTLDWMGWIRHPSHWLAGLRIMYKFQLETMRSDSERKSLLENLAIQCKKNEQAYAELDYALDHKLLLPGSGSIIVARTPDEVSELQDLKTQLEKEDRVLDILTPEEMRKRFDFVPTGLMYAEKTHDRVLSPNFMKLLSDKIKQEGGQVIDGTLTAIYADPQHAGGVAEYTNATREKHYLPYANMILSLGSQPIYDTQDQPVFDIVAARGISSLAYVSLPQGSQLPPALVCGGTNHVIPLTDQPVSVTDHVGKMWDVYLMRMTAGACITPNVSEKDTAQYDGSLALGLVTAVRKTLGDQCRVDPVLVYGCNRQVSQYGQTQWMSPYLGMYIQYGAGGGGLTRAPDHAVKRGKNHDKI